MQSELSDRVAGLEKETFDFYESIATSPLEHPIKQDVARVLIDHTRRVLGNVTVVCGFMKYKLNDTLYAAGIVHDIGRMRNRPKDSLMTEKEWIKYRDEYHHILSGEDCVPYLKRANFTDEEIEKTRALVEYHGVDIKAPADPEVIIVQVADKLDKLGVDGARRLFNLRRFHDAPTQKIKDGMANKMIETVAYLSRFNLPRDLQVYIEQKWFEASVELRRIGA
jgi:HD superfamily phosphohydrolase YqeK